MIERWVCPKCHVKSAIHLIDKFPVRPSIVDLVDGIEHAKDGEMEEMMFIGAHLGRLLWMKLEMERSMPEEMLKLTMHELTNNLVEQVGRFREERKSKKIEQQQEDYERAELLSATGKGQ